ncbi:mid1-interacting protein 1-B-like [Gadus chalcogrammus]|uniref:mid1-interacting protein 1-B-like n=1 Tax=Gadus chalcogrammus TaxID=1042646 RepID=UPI0024C48B81|nr:mid1-interacting protein 1-B-like [Gadus chalcogrammus]
MQTADNRLNKNSMVLALRRYSAAVNHMEHTVLLPTLLRDVPSDDLWDGEVEEEEASQDLYQNYLTLKAIKVTVESGLIPLDDRRSAKSRAATPSPSLTSGSPVEADQEALFHFHLSGLFSVLGHLTKKSQSLTEKYKEIIGVAY